jgi:hypothetical protein
MKTAHSIIFFVFAVVFSVPSFAQALTVSPARLEIAGDPGQTLNGEILLFEEANSSVSKNYYISFENFEPRGDSGAPYFIGAEDGLATWIRAPKEITLVEGIETKVPFSITIPPDTNPGGYFSAIFFGTQPVNSTGNSQVSVGGKVGVLILLRVNGDIEEGGGLVSFTLKDEKRFMVNPPIALEYRFNNTGGDRVVPKGTISVYNTFRFKTDEIDANQNTGSVLPGSSRRFEVAVGDTVQNLVLGEEDSKNFFEIVKNQLKDFRFGWYTAKLSISWGQTNQKADDKYHFFAFPWQSIIVLSVGFFGIFKLFIFLLRRYNRWILSQAGLYMNQKEIQHPKDSRLNENKKQTITKRVKKEKKITQKPLQKPKKKT